MSAQALPTFKCLEKVPPTEAGILAARRRAVEAFRRLGLEERYLFPIELSLHEALVNALVHGVKECGASQIRLCYEFNARCIRVKVEDDGGDDRKPAAGEPIAGTGLGLPLIHGLMSRVRVLAAGHGISMELDRAGLDGSRSGRILPIMDRRSGVVH